MAHMYRSQARYIQRKLLEEDGSKVSYHWLLLMIERHIKEAEEQATQQRRNVGDVLVDIIRPLNRERGTR